MACGVPVIASRSGGLPEVVRHGHDGILVEPGNVDELANAMAEILEDKNMRRHLAQNAHKKADYFSLDAHEEKMIEIFENTIAQSVLREVTFQKTIR
jgi:glycosyltransferase involved in cell wall biosynthesis